MRIDVSSNFDRPVKTKSGVLRNISACFHDCISPIDGASAVGWWVFWACYACFTGLAVAIGLWGAGDNFLDRIISDWAHRHVEFRGICVQQITRMGGIELITELCWLSAVALLVARRWHYVPAVFFGVLGEINVNLWLQDMITRPRPSYPGCPAIGSYSFPSGHAGAAAALCTFWIVVTLLESDNKALRRTVVTTLSAVMVGVAVTRVLLLAHWFTDVIGGVCFGAAWQLFCFWINQTGLHFSRVKLANASTPGWHQKRPWPENRPDTRLAG
jgi:membrane-associated phospholipid phosphatase